MAADKDTQSTRSSRFFENWSYATLPMAFLLLGFYPFVGDTIPIAVYLSLPVYMIHQYEEHDDNRFALFLNGMMGPDKRGLSPADVWVINVIFVWFLLLAVFYLATINLGWAVMAAYLLAINGGVHIIWAFAFRTYNPGLLTSILLFIPLAIWIFKTTQTSVFVHGISAFVILVLHAGIMILARRPAMTT